MLECICGGSYRVFCGKLAWPVVWQCANKSCALTFCTSCIIGVPNKQTLCINSVRETGALENPKCLKCGDAVSSMDDGEAGRLYK